VFADPEEEASPLQVSKNIQLSGENTPALIQILKNAAISETQFCNIGQM
jgi:hypothetical protein